MSMRKIQKNSLESFKTFKKEERFSYIVFHEEQT